MAMIQNCHIVKKGEDLVFHENINSTPSSFTRIRISKKRTRRVAFDDQNVTIAETFIVSELTPEEFQDYWFDGREFQMQTRSADLAAELFEYFGQTPDTGVCYRGLESRTMAAMEFYTNRFLLMIYAVLDEQDFQRSHGLTDTERLADVCRSATHGCQEEAWFRAKQDELAAQED